LKQSKSVSERAGVGTRAKGRTARPTLAFISRYEGLAEGLPFLVGARRRVKLPEGDLGPRAVAVVGHMAYTANYFSTPSQPLTSATPTPGPNLSLSQNPDPEIQEPKLI
jgi:hypothetical protein